MDQLDLRLQAPGPLFTFGFNIAKQHERIGIIAYDYFQAEQDSYCIQFPELLYGITDYVSILLAVPFVLSQRSEKKRSRGMGSFLTQLEMAIYKKEIEKTTYQTTIVSAILFPSATNRFPLISANKSISYFLGITQAFFGQYWAFYAECGDIITTKKHNNKIGNVLIYDVCFGCWLGKKEEFNIATLIETTGWYKGKGLTEGAREKPSHIFFIGPSFRIETQQLVIQTGFQIPVAQRGIRHDEKTNYRASFSLAIEL